MICVCRNIFAVPANAFPSMERSFDGIRYTFMTSDWYDSTVLGAKMKRAARTCVRVLGYGYKMHSLVAILAHID